MGTNVKHVFLGYALADREQAQELSRLLSTHFNCRVVSADSISVGEHWKENLRAEIIRCDLFMVLFASDEATQSSWVLSELGAAWALNKPIIIVTAQRESVAQIPLDLSKTHIVTMEELETTGLPTKLPEHDLVRAT